MPLEELLLSLMMFLAAVLYSSVGHAGASGYLALMALAGLSPAVMKPTALCLNILVAIIASYKFVRVGAFSWRLFWPFAVASIPFAYLGGTLNLPAHFYKPLVGFVLLYAAWRSFVTAQKSSYVAVARPPNSVLLLLGAGLGFLSGLTGVGGGIFLSPLLLFFRWADVKVISGISAVFILVNSIAGLLGVIQTSPALPETLPYWCVAVLIGGFIGAEFGSRRFANPVIQKLLALVLVIAGAKMVASVF